MGNNGRDVGIRVKTHMREKIPIMRGPRFDPPKRQLYMTYLLFFFVCLVFCKNLAQPKPESDPISHDWTMYWFPYETSICLGLLTPLAPVEFADPRSDCWPPALLVSAR